MNQGCTDKEIMISIHALREEGDEYRIYIYSKTSSISIHALREEGDMPGGFKPELTCISIHALREEGDPLQLLYTTCMNRYFYPRPP